MSRALIVRPPFCEDEGCPHHGTPHFCRSVSPSEYAREAYRRIRETSGVTETHLTGKTAK